MELFKDVNLSHVVADDLKQSGDMVKQVVLAVGDAEADFHVATSCLVMSLGLTNTACLHKQLTTN